jgi:UPF0176 protein
MSIQMPTCQSYVLSRDSVLALEMSEEQEEKFLILSFYYLVPIENPSQLVQEFFDHFSGSDCKGRIYIASQGINATLSAPSSQAKRFMKWLASYPHLDSNQAWNALEFKVEEVEGHVFARLTIKRKKELVALDKEVLFSERGERVSPACWKKMLDEESDVLLLDIRNDYEWELGHFEGAKKPVCTTFRDFKKFAKEVSSEIDQEHTKVMMYCTGGIRCEFFSALLKECGVKNVYQLDGGVIKYGIEEKSSHWLGKLFVFDDRLAADISDEPAPPIGTCFHCQDTAEKYYNCANMNCNTLFLSCPSCLEKYKGCCREECACGSRVRPYKLSSTPFRRWYEYAKKKEELDHLYAKKQEAS